MLPALANGQQLTWTGLGTERRMIGIQKSLHARCRDVIRRSGGSTARPAVGAEHQLGDLSPVSISHMALNYPKCHRTVIRAEDVPVDARNDNLQCFVLDNGIVGVKTLRNERLVDGGPARIPLGGAARQRLQFAVVRGGILGCCTPGVPQCPAITPGASFV